MKTRSKNIVIVSLLLIAVILIGAVVFDIVNKRVLTDDTKQEAIGKDDVINEENETIDVPEIKDDANISENYTDPIIDVSQITRNPDAELLDVVVEQGTKEGTNIE